MAINYWLINGQIPILMMICLSILYAHGIYFINNIWNNLIILEKRKVGDRIQFDSSNDQLDNSESQILKKFYSNNDALNSK